jgi:hypothetical protein
VADEIDHLFGAGVDRQPGGVVPVGGHVVVVAGGRSAVVVDAESGRLALGCR